MLVVGVVSLKGGVGKTTVTLGLAGAAMGRGLRTLVVDLDPQGNATSALAPPSVRFSANDVLSDGRAGVLRDAITASSWGPGVDVVASEPALEHRNRADQAPGEHRLRTTMAGIDGYDLVLLDCPPSLGELTKNALAASHRVLVVTEPTLFAVTGAQQALSAVDVVRRGFNLRLQTAGIVVNRYHRRSSEHRYRLQELTDAYNSLVLTSTLPDRAALVHAQGAAIPVQRVGSPGAREAGQVFESYLDHLLSSALDDGPLIKAKRKG